MKDKIAIVLATYNGELYLREQLDSVMSASYQKFQVFIRDDGSKDHTCEIIQEYEETYPGKICRIQDGKNIKSASGNFMQLFRHLIDKREFSYVMCMDQDDIWNVDKIFMTLSTMKKAEAKWGQDIPILVHTDLRVIDQQRREIARSFMEYSRLDPDVTDFYRMLAYNNVTGCTMMLNRKLLEMSIRGTEGMFMHDWWCALIASAFGKIVFLNKQTLDYRQHMSNTVGASDNRSFRTLINKTRGFLKKVSCNETLFDQTIQQAKVFRKAFLEEMDRDILEGTTSYCNLGSMSRVRRFQIFLRYGFWSQGIARCLGQIAFLIMHKREREKRAKR